MKQLYSLTFLLLAVFFVSCTTEEKKPKTSAKKNDKIPANLIISDINNNFITLGSYINVFFATPNPSRDNITFDKVQIPKGTEAFLQPKGISNLIITPTQLTNKQLVTKIIAKSPLAQKNIEFKTTVQKVKGNIYYAAPEKSKKIGQKMGGHELVSINRVIENMKLLNQAATIFLTSGNYGILHINNANNITIIPKIAESPIFASIKITNSNHCTIQAVTVTSENQKGKNSYYIQIDSSSSDITIRNCIIQAANKTEKWEPKDWATKASNGIYSEGDKCIFQHNLIRNIHHGLETKGDGNLVNNNIIVRFAGDAIRNTGDNNIFIENYMADALVDDYYAKGGNHDDLFQSWTLDKPIKHITVQSNIAINCTDTTIHLQSKNVQGLVCFDGMEEHWIIKKNLVILEHPHGITLFGAQNCKVTDNRIIPNPFNKYEFESAPWIMIANHKDGRPSHNNLVSNNLASVLKITDSTAVIKNNSLISNDPSKYFPNYWHWVF